MTVLRMNSSDGYAAPRQDHSVPVRNRQAVRPASYQMQDWTRGMEYSSGSRHSVIARKASVLPVFSAEGIRWDALVIIFTLLLLLFAGILFSDLEALHAGGERIGKLSAGIESLEGSNAMLQEELTLVMRHPVLVRMNETAGSEEETESVITLSAAPVP